MRVCMRVCVCVRACVCVFACLRVSACESVLLFSTSFSLVLIHALVHRPHLQRRRNRRHQWKASERTDGREGSLNSQTRLVVVDAVRFALSLSLCVTFPAMCAWHAS